MKNDTGILEASRQYQAAHAAHYVTKDLREAIMLYKAIMTAYPNTEEAGYSRSQIQNIVKATVPEQELLDAQLDCVSAHFEHSRQTVSRAPVTSAAAGLPS
jgi:hypothetical protein